MQSRIGRVVVVALTCGGVALPVLAQTPAADSLLTNLNKDYGVSKMGFGGSSRVTAPGNVYVVHVDGLLARAVSDHVTPTTTIKDGQPLPSAKGFKGAFGAVGDTRQIAPGDRFYVIGIDLKDDAIVFRLDSLDMHGVEANGSSVQSRFRMYVKFPVAKGAAETMTVADVHRLTDPIFSAEGAPATAPQVQMGESLVDVEKAFGQPDKVVDLGSKKILSFGSLKVTLVDDKVTDAE
jgi:hypothetical protein